MFKLEIDKNSGSQFSITDFRAIRRELAKIEPSLRRDLDREIRQIAKPAMDAVKAAIPSQGPLSGMNNHSGRTAWRASNPTQMKIYKPRKGSPGKLTVTLVGVRVMSAAVSIADIAGRTGSRFGGNGKTRDYSWKGTSRNHSISPASGAKFSSSLTSSLASKAFRISFPNVDKHLSQIEREIEKVLEKAYKTLNGKLFS